MTDDIDEQEAKKNPLMMNAVKAFKTNYISPIRLRCVYNAIYVLYVICDHVRQKGG